MKFFGLFKERSIEQELESTDEKLKKSEKGRSELLRRRNKWYQFARRLFVVSILLSFILILVAQFLTLHWSTYIQGNRLYLAMIVVLCLNYLFYYGLKRFINWYYSFMISSIDKQIELLDESIFKLLSKAMESESYNKTKELLNKYSRKKFDEMERVEDNVQVTSDLNKKAHEEPETKGQSDVVENNTSTSVITAATTNENNDPVCIEEEKEVNKKRILSTLSHHVEEQPYANETKNPMPVNRSIFEKFVDFLIGDGPSNKYALVCARCHFHNGLAFPEEFSTLEYRCVNCKFMNMGRSRVRRVNQLTMDHSNREENIDPTTLNNETTLRRRNFSHAQSTSKLTFASDQEQNGSLSEASSTTDSKNNKDSDVEVIAHHL